MLFFTIMVTDRYNQRGVSADKEDVHNAIKNVDITSTDSGLKEPQKWDYFVVSSNFEKAYIKSQLLLKESQMLNFGHPRNDILINNTLKAKKTGNKLVLYAPTFRDSEITKLFPFKTTFKPRHQNAKIYNAQYRERKALMH